MPFTSCPVCDTLSGEPFFTLESAPALCHRLCRLKDEALAQPMGPIELTFCRGCGLVYNRAFDGNRIQYDGEYENALHFSGVFRDYANGLAKRLIDRYGVQGKTVAEIGCGDGQFLAALCEAGARDGLGFDPAYDITRHEIANGGGIRIVPHLFDASELQDVDVGLVCCRHVLEHIERPAEFLQQLRTALGPQSAPVFFEVPSAMHSIERRGFWDVIYEHVTYFTPEAIRVAFERTGFDVEKTEEVYSGQFLTIEAQAGDGDPESAAPMERIDELEALATRFGNDFETLRIEWRERLAEYRAAGKQCVIWGAGSKTVMFLNSLGSETDAIASVVDCNPRKHDCYIVGTGQRIIAPDALRELQPDVVILMNPAYEDEVQIDLRALGCDAVLMVVA